MVSLSQRLCRRMAVVLLLLVVVVVVVVVAAAAVVVGECGQLVTTSVQENGSSFF